MFAWANLNNYLFHIFKDDKEKKALSKSSGPAWGISKHTILSQIHRNSELM